MRNSERRSIAIIAFGMEHCKRGVETHARMLFDRLSEEQDMQVTLIKGSGVSSESEVVLSVPKRHTLLNRTLGKLRGYNVYWEQVFFMLRLAFHMIKNHKRYDVIYTQEYVHLIGVAKMKKWFSWSFDVVYCEGFVSESFTRLKYADRIQEVNKGNYDRIRSSELTSDMQVELIPHFFDSDERALDLIDEKELERIKTFKGHAHLILHVGPTDLPEKNFKVLEEAMEQLSGDWKLLECGDVSEGTRKKLESKFPGRFLSTYVDHATMQHIYPLADIYVLPSLQDGFGIATIEAMSHGLPVCVHDSAHSRWISADVDQCVNMNNSSDLIDHLNAIDNLKEYRNAKGRSNKEHFKSTFTWEHVREDYLDLLFPAYHEVQ